MVAEIALLAAGYLCGSISSAIVVCRAFGHADPRAGGSGNPGATNVLRLYGKIAAGLTLAGDVAKGLLPVLLASHLGVSPAIVALTGLAAFFGHLFPVFFGFQGGKGIATYIGILAGIAWPLAVVFAACWVVIAALFRYSSVAGLTATVVTPAAAYCLRQPIAVVAVTAVAALAIVWRHRRNIRSLLKGQETRIGATRKPEKSGQG